jgi:DNA-binding IclR family transcriptional regulator
VSSAILEREALGTVARVVRVLQCLAEIDGDVSIKELAAKLSLPPSTVHRLLHLLIDDGIVERSHGGHLYRPGLELVRIASLVASKSRIADVALPFMRNVVETCNEVCMLVRYLPSSRQVMVAASIDSTNPLRYQVELFTPHSLLWGATGRGILAFLPDAVIAQARAEATPSPVTGEAVPGEAELLQALMKIRDAGYVLTNGQKIGGAVGMGAPVFDAGGGVIGSLCITVPKLRFRAEAEAELADLLCRQANALSQTLGFSGRPVR